MLWWGGQDGIYEFYDLEYYGWSGNITNASGNGAGLDTSSAGVKSVTCNGGMRFRCTGGEDIVGPVSVSATATFTVNDNNQQPLTATINPSGTIETLEGCATTLSCTAAGGTPPYYYTWTFPSGAPATSTLDNATVTWSTAGEHQVSVVVKDSSQPQKSTNPGPSATVKVYKIASETVHSPTPYSRTTIGIGEEVNLKILKADGTSAGTGTWSLTSGPGEVDDQGGGKGFLTAKGTAGTIKATANVGGAYKDISFTSIVPTGIGSNGSTTLALRRGTGTSAAQMLISTKLTPNTVSFYNLSIREEDGGTTNTNFPHPGLPSAWYSVSVTNSVSASDKVGGTFTAPYPATGYSFNWICNWVYRCNVDNVTGLTSGAGYLQNNQATPTNVNGKDVINLKSTKFGETIDNSAEPVQDP